MDPPDKPKKDLLEPFGYKKKLKGVYTDKVDGVPDVQILNLDHEEKHN